VVLGALLAPTIGVAVVVMADTSGVDRRAVPALGGG